MPSPPSSSPSYLDQLLSLPHSLPLSASPKFRELEVVDVLFEVYIGFCAVWGHSIGGVHLTDPTNLFSFLISGTTTQICKYIHIHM